MKDESIHPGRAKYGRKYNPRIREDGEKICAPRNSNRKGHLAKASAELDRRRRDQNVTQNSLGSRFSPGSYKVPGSMNIN